MMTETNEQAEEPKDEKGPRDNPGESVNGAIKSRRPNSIGANKKVDKHRHEIASVAVAPA
jgi:hypothetical protein